MYELFTIAPLLDNQVYKVRQVLQGYSSRTEEHKRNRLLFYRGPDHPAGFNKVRELEQTPNRRLWNDLHQFFSKQSYFVYVRYPADEAEFGQPVDGQVALDQRRGTLRWSDIPDPLPAHALHTQRKMLEIHDQDRLLSILGRNGHILTRECIEEIYTWFQPERYVELSLERISLFPGDSPYAKPTAASPRASLPPLSDLQPLSTNWHLYARVKVPDPTPESMAAAAASLAAVREDLHGVIDFEQFDRRIHDTRHQAAPPSNMPLPLPQVLTVDRV